MVSLEEIQKIENDENHGTGFEMENRKLVVSSSGASIKDQRGYLIIRTSQINAD